MEVEKVVFNELFLGDSVKGRAMSAKAKLEGRRGIGVWLIPLVSEENDGDIRTDAIGVATIDGSEWGGVSYTVNVQVRPPSASLAVAREYVKMGVSPDDIRADLDTTESFDRHREHKLKILSGYCYTDPFRSLASRARTGGIRAIRDGAKFQTFFGSLDWNEVKSLDS